MSHSLNLKRNRRQGREWQKLLRINLPGKSLFGMLNSPVPL